MYLVFPFIYPFASAPITRAYDPNDSATVGEPYGKDVIVNLSKTVITLFFITVGQIFGDHTIGIDEGVLRLSERHPVLGLVDKILPWIPVEAFLARPCIIL